ncbi:MAG: hypothetical protein IT294_15490 [Deltaproteobacteria bacterium]|nr:hypothetical protein [Deltaproteobacteria bacterium]
METRRIDHVVVVTPDAEGAAATFRRHFELAPSAPVVGSPALRIGGARIAFAHPADGSALAAILARSGEGMAEICLEVGSLPEAEASLRTAGIGFTVEAKGAARALAVDPGAAHGVRLTLIEGRAA